jgi:hypothetical protein
MLTLIRHNADNRCAASPDIEETDRPRKRSFVGNEGQSSSAQVEEDDDHVSDEDKESAHKSFEDRAHESEEEVLPKCITRNAAGKKPVASPPRIWKTRAMPVRDGVVFDKKRPRHSKNYKVKNYKKLSKVEYATLRSDTDHFYGAKTSTDSRVWSRVQQDIYESIILKEKTTLVPQSFVNMEIIEKNRDHFLGCLEIVDGMGLRDILTFHRD